MTQLHTGTHNPVLTQLVTDLDLEIAHENQAILKSKIRIARLKAAKTNSVKSYEFVRTQQETNELLAIIGKVPEITSARELQIVYYISKMWTAKAMAEAMFISEKTVKYHKTCIYRKLNVRSEKELITKYFSQQVQHDTLPVARELAR